MNWQPIDTIPKDGSWILAYASFRIEIVRWEKDLTVRGKSRPAWIVHHRGPDRVFNPVVWMPLPAPPPQEPRP